MKGLIGAEMDEDREEPGEPPEDTPADEAEDAAEQEPADEGGQQEGMDAPDDQYEMSVQAVITAASRVLKAPEMKQRVAQVASVKELPQQAIELANLTYDIIVGVDDKTQGTIPFDALVGGALGTLGMLVELVNAPPALIAAAAQSMVARFAEENGADPAEVQQALGSIAPEEATGKVEQAMQEA